MDKNPSQMRAVQTLYPPINPFDQRMIAVSGGHEIYVEQCGNPQGQPVIVLHGGPGGGCSPAMRRFFSPDHYRVILFDQRGCGRSRPYASVENNTTWDLVSDIETIRSQLGIDRMVVFGGSWGATLSLIYAISHPERVSDLILRGVFLMTQVELDWFYGGGAQAFWPEAWGRFASHIPTDEQGDMIKAYHKRLFSGNLPDEIRAAQAWTLWENALASVASNGQGGAVPGDYARAFARLENHYFINRGFLPEDGWIMNNLDKIANIPGVIVQGRYDMICPPQRAYELSRNWDNCDLIMVRDAGHAMSEPGIAKALVRSMDAIAGLI
jgi:proline iminopeptidase